MYLFCFQNVQTNTLRLFDDPAFSMVRRAVLEELGSYMDGSLDGIV